MIGKFVSAWLAQDAETVSIVANRIYPLTTPQNVAFPHVTYQVITTTLADNLTEPGGLETARVQIDCWAEGKGGYAQVQALARAIVGPREATKLHLYRTSGGSYLGGIDVQCARRIDQFDDVTEPENASDDTIQRVSLDFMISYGRP